MNAPIEFACKWALILSAAITALLWLTKDRLPPPAFYDLPSLQDPRQAPADRPPFRVEAGGQQYEIKPVQAYELDGVVMSFSNADGFTNIWHHRDWKDFINLRDLCVVWGENVASGVYRDIRFENDSWTCWFSWSDAATGTAFRMTQASNNHLLAMDERVKRALMSAEPGDQIRLSGVLAEYRNLGNGASRGTSTRRDDTGNGACETIWLDRFEVVRRANPLLRGSYALFKWLTMASLLAWLGAVMFLPYRSAD